jgi:hypothetical protein
MNHLAIRKGVVLMSVHNRACDLNLPFGSRINTQRMGSGGLPV